MAADNIGEALILLTQLNQKLIQQVGGNKSGTPESEFKEPPKDVIIQDFRAPALEKLNSISGRRIANTGDQNTADAGEKGKGLFSTILTVLGIGAGIAGLTVAFGAADKALSFLGDGSTLSSFLGNLGKGLGDFTAGGGLVAIGAMIGAAGVFQIVDNIPGVKVGGLSLAMGIVSIGLGLAGFVSALALSDKLMDMLGTGNPGESLATFMTNLSEGLKAFEGPHLAALGGLLGAGALFGAVPGLGASAAGGAALGMTAIGAGIGGFFLGMAGGDAVMRLIGEGDPGGSIRKLMVNLSEGLKSFEGPHLTFLGTLLGAGALFGAVPGLGAAVAGSAALGMTAIGAGIGGFFGGIVAVEGIMKFISGGNPGGTIRQLMENLGAGLSNLSANAQNIKNENMDILLYAAQKASAALTLMGGGTLVNAITTGLAKVVNFFSGNTDPFSFIKDLSNDVDKIDAGANALDKVANALQRFSEFDFTLNFNFKKFGDDLKASVPLIEAAIFGQDGGVFGTPTKGLASIGIGINQAVSNINKLKLLFEDEESPIKDTTLNKTSNMLVNNRPIDPENDVISLTRTMRDNIDTLVKNQSISNKILASIDSNNVTGNKDIVNAIGSIEFTPINRGITGPVTANTVRDTKVRNIQENAVNQFSYAT